MLNVSSLQSDHVNFEVTNRVKEVIKASYMADERPGPSGFLETAVNQKARAQESLTVGSPGTVAFWQVNALTIFLQYNNYYIKCIISYIHAFYK
jgi:hypothetical protein